MEKQTEEGEIKRLKDQLRDQRLLYRHLILTLKRQHQQTKRRLQNLGHKMDLQSIKLEEAARAFKRAKKEPGGPPILTSQTILLGGEGEGGDIIKITEFD